MTLGSPVKRGKTSSCDALDLSFPFAGGEVLPKNTFLSIIESK